MLKKFNNDKLELFGDTYQDNNGSSDWLSVNSKPKTVKEKLVSYIIKKSGFLIKDGEEIEYWTHVHSPESNIVVDGKNVIASKKLGWHTNKDEVSNKEDKKLVHPIISFVYWPINDHFEGGYLEISSIKPSEINLDIFNSPDSILSFVSKFKNDYERIEAKYNRLVIFDSSYIHRVTEVTQGIRWTFTFDIWNKLIHKKEKQYE